MAETFGITVKELFWTQGRYDVVTVLEAPDEFSAMTLSLVLVPLAMFAPSRCAPSRRRT